MIGKVCHKWFSENRQLFINRILNLETTNLNELELDVRKTETYYATDLHGNQTDFIQKPLL